MILVPPLRRPAATLSRRGSHPQLSAILAQPAPSSPSSIQPARAPAPVPLPAAEKRPKEPPPALALHEYFCRTCDRRETGRVPPPGWLNLRRHVCRGTLAPPLGRSKQEREVRRRRCSMGLGLYCSWPCLMAAMPRLSELYRALQEQGVGACPLQPGEAPFELPPSMTQGGLE